MIEININFHNDISKMPFHDLRTPLEDDFINDYVIMHLNLQKLVNSLDSKDIVSKFIMDDRMMNLCAFIKTGSQLIPPVLRYVNKGVYMIYDGKHRVALFIKCKIQVVPFLIKAEHSKYFNEFI